MASRILYNVIIPASVLSAMSANTYNYVALDGSNTTLNSGQANLASITTYPPAAYIGNGGYYNALRFHVMAGAQTTSTSMIMDIWEIPPPGTVLAAGSPISAVSSSSPGRVTLAAGAATITINDYVQGGAITGRVVESMVYPHFVMAIFCATLPAGGGPIQVIIEGISNPGPALVS